MKLEVGKTYKSNVTDTTLPGGICVPEEWTILFKQENGPYVGKCVRKNGLGALLREFNEEGRDGSTNNGRGRCLLPNTRAVEQWGIMRISSGEIYHYAIKEKRFDNTKEGAEAWLKSLPTTNNYRVAKCVYEVED